MRGFLSSESGVCDMSFLTAHDEKIRFLIGGAWNTAFSYALYVSFLFLFGSTHYLLLSAVTWVITVVQSWAVLRVFVFRSHGRWPRELGRAYLVYGPTYLLNLAILWVCVHFAGLPPFLGQAIALLLVTVVSYLGHKYFTFASPADVIEHDADAT